MYSNLPIVLGGVAIVVMLLVASLAMRRQQRARRRSKQQGAQGGMSILIHSINDDRCTGCDACVAVCPTNVLDLISNKSRVLRFQDCIQCEACMWACPTEALVMHKQGTQPPPLKVPDLDKNFQTAVPGQYLIGEVAGKPLVKNAANLGRAVIENMLQGGLRAREEAGPGSNFVDVAIVGSGPGGLSAALTCIKHGLSYIIFEKEQQIASTIARYPKGKLVMAEPYDTQNVSFLPVFDSSKEQLIPIWQDIIDTLDVRISLGEAVEAIDQHKSGLFRIRSNMGKYAAQRVVLATGTRGKPRTLGVPGENLPKIHNLLEDPADFRGKAVIVIGGGDSALEAAMALADAGASVLVSYRGRAFARAQAKNKAGMDSYIKQKRLKVVFQSQVAQFAEDTVTIQLVDGSTKSYPNHAAFVLIGSIPPIKWLATLGVHFVEKPHLYSLGKTDDIALRNAMGNVQECPETAAEAIALLGGQAVAPPAPRAATAPPPPPPQHAGRAQTASVVARIADVARNVVRRKPRAPTYGRHETHSGTGRRDSLQPHERARLLRQLRDDGARFADMESIAEFEESASQVATNPAAFGKSPPPPVRAPLPGPDGLTQRQREAIDHVSEFDGDSTRAVDLSALTIGEQLRAKKRDQPAFVPRLDTDDGFSADQTKAVDLNKLDRLIESSSRDEQPRMDTGRGDFEEDATKVFDLNEMPATKKK